MAAFFLGLNVLKWQYAYSPITAFWKSMRLISCNPDTLWIMYKHIEHFWDITILFSGVKNVVHNKSAIVLGLYMISPNSHST